MGSPNNTDVGRRLAAIVIADVVGYTRLMERGDTGTFARLRTIRDEVVDPAIGPQWLGKRGHRDVEAPAVPRRPQHLGT